MLLIVSPQFPACCENEIIDVCKALRTCSDERHEQSTPTALSFLPRSCLHAPPLRVGPLHSAHLAVQDLGPRYWTGGRSSPVLLVPTLIHSWLLISKNLRGAPRGWHPPRQRLFKAIASPHRVISITILIKLILWPNVGGPAQKLLREVVLSQSFLSLHWSYGRGLGFSAGILFLSLLLWNSPANSAEICILKWK